MDFVQLVNDDTEDAATAIKRSKDVATYLNDDDDESMAEEDSDDDEDKKVRAKVSQADDYDFTAM
jgi:hypothetical protein